MSNEEQDIEIIISGCRSGSQKAQEQLYRRFYRVMMNLCLRYTKNESEALEALNTGFYKVFKNIDRYDDRKGSVYTWIRIIIINSCLDIIKIRQTQPKTGDLTDADLQQIPANVITKLSATEILGLVRQLPTATQAVFNLYVIEGYSHKEIAELTGISEGTSKWHLSDARKKLQKMINEQTI